MLKCPSCANEEDFDVIECLWQRTRIACSADGSYTFINEEEFISVEEWGDITCIACSKVYGEDELRTCFNLAHGQDEDSEERDGDPIPFLPSCPNIDQRVGVDMLPATKGEDSGAPVQPPHSCSLPKDSQA